ncbi:MAG: MotA/TolQ/ExbB proton channel family protein [Pseudomonadota bacterium]
MMDHWIAFYAWLSNLIDKGGVLVYPLLALLVIATVIIVYKAISLRRKRTLNPELIQHVERLLINRKLNEATHFCQENSRPITRILLAAIVNSDKSESDIKEILEEAGRQEVPRIRSHLSTLGTIASVSPLLGLLGTVLGMISVFATLSADTGVEAGKLAGGISEALVTTAVGMVVAMPALACYNYFATKVQNLIIEMERVSLHMVALLKRGPD